MHQVSGTSGSQSSEKWQGSMKPVLEHLYLWHWLYRQFKVTEVLASGFFSCSVFIVWDEQNMFSTKVDDIIFQIWSHIFWLWCIVEAWDEMRRKVKVKRLSAQWPLSAHWRFGRPFSCNWIISGHHGFILNLFNGHHKRLKTAADQSFTAFSDWLPVLLFQWTVRCTQILPENYLLTLQLHLIMPSVRKHRVVPVLSVMSLALPCPLLVSKVFVSFWVF